MKKLFLAVCFTAALTLSAGVKIAVIDMHRVFKEYYKSRIAEEFIRQQAEAAKVYLGQLNQQLESLRANARKTGTDALNQALDESSREKLRRESDSLLRKIKAKEAEIELFSREKMRNIQSLEEKKRSEIIQDIKSGIARRAAAEGYTHVFDSSGMTNNNQPAILHFPANCDISNAVIRELNRSAVKPVTGGAR